MSTAGAGLLLVKLPDASTIDPAWKVWILVVAVVATVAGLLSMWTALTATAGNPANITRERFEKTYSSFDDFVARRMSAAVRRLNVARVCAVVSVVALLVGACVLWVAPAEQSLRVKVEVGDTTVCGTVSSGDHGELRVKVAGERDVRVVPYSDVRNLRVVAAC